MKIGITCYPTYGGSGAVATELGIALAARGHEVHFITYKQPFRLPSFLPRVYFHEVDVLRYPLFEFPPYDLALAVRMHEVVRDHGLEVLHVHYAIPHATSAWIAREMLEDQDRSVRVITTLHGTDITLVGQDPSFQAITKFSIERSDGLSAVSEYLRKETYTAFGCSTCAVDVIPNFVDPRVYDRAAYPPLLREQVGAKKKILIARVELPAGEARARRRAHLRGRAARDAGGPGHGGRRSRSRCRRRGSARSRRARSTCTSSASSMPSRRSSRAPTCSCCPVESESFGLCGARGARVRRAGRVLERGRHCPRSCATA